jgi:hypothetical protein
LLSLCIPPKPNMVTTTCLINLGYNHFKFIKCPLINLPICRFYLVFTNMKPLTVNRNMNSIKSVINYECTNKIVNITTSKYITTLTPFMFRCFLIVTYVKSPTHFPTAFLGLFRSFFYLSSCNLIIFYSGCPYV